MTKRKRVLLAFGILLAGAAVYGLAQVTGESSGAILPVQQAAAASSQAPLQISDKYASFSYPNYFVPLTSDKPVLPVLARHNLRSQTDPHFQIAVQVTHLENSNLQDDGSYNFRISTPSRFIKSSLTAGTNKVTAFTDTTASGFNKVAYLQHNNMSASVALTSALAGSDTSVENDFMAVLASWQWY